MSKLSSNKRKRKNSEDLLTENDKPVEDVPKNPYKKKKKKKRPYEIDPASSDSSDLEYPEVRKASLERELGGEGDDKKKRPGIKGKRGKRKDTTKRKDEGFSPHKVIRKSESGGNKCGPNNTKKIINKEYLKYKAVMDMIWLKKEEEEREKKRLKEIERKKFIPERFQKTGAATSIVHPLKFIVHGHNRQHMIGNDPIPSTGRSLYEEAISMGKSGTLDSYLIQKSKTGAFHDNPEEIDQLMNYTRSRLRDATAREMAYLKPPKPIYDDGTSNSVRIGMDVQRFTLSRQGYARMNPIRDQLSRHIISPETSSKERAKRMGEGIMDAVDRDLQDMPKIKKIEATEQKAMESLKDEIREYLGDRKITDINEILQLNALKTKISPLLEILNNNQHPGIKKEKDFFLEAVNQIVQENTTKTEDQKQSNLGLKKSRKVSLSNLEDFNRDEYITNLMKKVPVKYTDPTTNVEITVGERLIPVKEGEDPSLDDTGNPLSPVPLQKFPFVLSGDGKAQKRMRRSLKKMKQETLLSRREYASVFHQEMAPQEPRMETFYKERNNSSPTNRFGQEIRPVSFSKSNKHGIRSLHAAKKKIQQSKDADGEDEGEPMALSGQYVKNAIEKTIREREEDNNIMCPRLPNYKEDTVEDEEPSATDHLLFERRSCIMQLVDDQKRRQQEFEWMVSVYSGKISVDEILENPSMYQGAGGAGLLGLGEPCDKEYLSDFRREAIGNERSCCNDKKCIGAKIPLLKNWPDTADGNPTDGPILREFFRPDQLKIIMETCKYPEDRNPCVLCIDKITTQAAFSFASNSSSPKCCLQYYWVKGYPKKVLLPVHSGRKNKSTGIFLDCKMFRIQDYFLSTIKMEVGGKMIDVKCYEEREYTEEEAGSGGIAKVTLNDKPITNSDFWGASVVSVKD